MRERFGKRLTLVLVALVAIGVLVPAIALTQGDAEPPDLVASAASEPPDFVVRGESFLVSVTVSNQGGRRARQRSTVRAYLSVRPRRSPAEGVAPLAGSARVRGIRRDGQRGTRFRATVPADQNPGTYYLIVCVDDTKAVAEDSERNNCRLSGQTLRVAASATDGGGPRGAAGPSGPPGEKGDRGPAALDVFTFGPTTLTAGQANVDDVADDANEGDSDPEQGTPDEGSTEKQTVMNVGPFEFRVLCRQQVPNTDEESYDTRGAQGRATEAKVLVYTNEGSYSSQGRQGARTNVLAGEGVAGAEGGGGGEGKHQIIAAMRHRDEGLGQGQDDNFVGDLTGHNVLLVHSNGWEVMFDGYATVDVMTGEPGHGNVDQCLFGGSATVINKP